MLKISSVAARLALAASLPLISTSCASTRGLSDQAAGLRALPAAADVVPAPAERPEPRAGQDARLFAREALDYGDANAARLDQAREAYQGLVDLYARPPN